MVRMEKEAGKWVTLDSMTSEHIEAILDTQRHIFGTVIEVVFKNELEYRERNNL